MPSAQVWWLPWSGGNTPAQIPSGIEFMQILLTPIVLHFNLIKDWVDC